MSERAVVDRVERVRDLLPEVGRLMHDLYGEVDARQLAKHLRVDLDLVRELIAYGSGLPSPSGRGQGKPRAIRPRTALEGAEGESLSGRAKPSVDTDKAVRRPGHRQGPRPCEVCDRPFEGGRVDAIYCDEGCRRLAYRQRKGEDVAAQIEAKRHPPVCEGPRCEELMVPWVKGQRFCSATCSRNHRRERTS